MDGHPLYDLIGQYGLYAVFLLAMIEGDLTLLVAGVMAHHGFFGEYSFLKVACAGTLGGVAGDNAAYGMGRSFGGGISYFRFYRVARPRLERLTDKFGALSIFLSKYIYGLRTASCVFYGMGHMRYWRFLPLAFASCLLWVLILSGAGYFFSGAITGLIGDFERLGKILLVIVVIGIAVFYLTKRLWISKKVEEANPELIHELEHAAQEKLHEFQERIHLKAHPSSKDPGTSPEKRNKRD